MIDLLFVASDYKPSTGGIAAYVDNLARGLIGLGATVKVAAIVPACATERIEYLMNYEPWVLPFAIAYDERPGNWIGNKIMSACEILRCVVPCSRYALERTSLFEASAEAVERFGDVLSREKPTMVVFGHLDLNLYAFALHLQCRKIPYVIIAHDCEVYRHLRRANDTVRRGQMLRRAEFIVANSHHTKALVETWGIRSQEIKVIHPPLAPELVAESLRFERIGEDNACLRLVSVCRLVKSKGLDIVLQALKILAGKGVPFSYVIAGEGTERAALARLAGELGLEDKVRFAGYVDEEEKYRVFRNGEVFVMPSRVDPKEHHEGFGLAFIEAAAFGLVGVGASAGGMVDAIVAGETGILVPPESPEDLANALTFLYRNPRARFDMARIGRERARTRFLPAEAAALLMRGICWGHSEVESAPTTRFS
jgi:glycosyltransferase involved in cell wall biosynthesis